MDLSRFAMNTLALAGDLEAKLDAGFHRRRFAQRRDRRADRTRRCRGYGGDYTFEVFNDDCRRSPAPVVMERACKSVEWLGARTSLAAPDAVRLSDASR